MSGPFEKYYSIGGSILSISGLETARLASRLPGMAVFEVTECRPGEKIFRIETDRETACTEGTILHSFGFDDIKCSFGKADDRYFLRMTRRGTSGRFDLQYFPTGNHVTTGKTDDPDMLRYGLWSAYGLLSAGFSTLQLHASTVCHNGGAVLFLGESGTGKSTQSRLWVEHIPDTFLLNDDSPLISCACGLPRAYGSPWSGKTHCYHSGNYPVKAILRLRQAPRNRIARLGPLESFGAVYPSAPPSLAYDRCLTDLVCDNLSVLLAHVPVYTLDCLPQRQAALLAYETIFG